MTRENVPADPQKRGEAKPQGGIAVPVKGDSSASNPPPISDDATLIDSPFPSARPVSSNLDPEMTRVDVDATTGDWVPPQRSAFQRTSARVVFNVPIFEVGDLLGGRYEIVKLLGEGGMGAVYKAVDRELDRPVALKVIRPELASNASMLARFKQ